MGIDPGRLFPFGGHVGPDGNLKAGGKGLDQYLWPFGNNVDANGNVKPRGGGKLAGGYYGPGGNPDASGQGQAQQKPAVGPYQGHTKPATASTPSPTVPTRDVAKADGSKGTQTSPGGGMPVLDAATAAAFLQSKGIGLGAFSSIQLPGTQSNPNTGIVPDAVPFGGQEQSVTANTLGAFTRPNGLSMPNLGVTGMEGVTIEQAFTDPKIGQALSSTFSQYGGLATGNGAFARPTQGSKSYKELSPTDPLYAEAFGEDLAKKNGGGGSSRLNAALADTAGMQSYMSKFGSPEQDMRRAADMAFLNTSGSQEGLRAKEAVLGQFTAGGQTYQLNDTGTELIQGENGKPLAIDRKAASAYRLGTIDAETYKNSYKDQVKAIPAATITTPKQAENPTAQNPVPVSRQQVNTNFGPVIDEEAAARVFETSQGMKGMGPVANGQAYGEYLDGMR